MKNTAGAVRARQHAMVNYIKERGFAGVAELAAHFGVSSVTVRKDLDLLAQEGVLIRSFGGAEFPKTPLEKQTGRMQAADLSLRSAKTGILYRRLAGKAASLLRDGDVVFLGNSSLAVRSLEFIEKRMITVVTNRLESLLIPHDPNISLVLTGGTVDRSYTFMSGASAVETLLRYRAGCCILGLDSPGPSGSLSEYGPEDIYWNHQLVELTTERVIAVIPPDSLQAARQVLSADLDRVTDIVTVRPKTGDSVIPDLLFAGKALHYISNEDDL